MPTQGQVNDFRKEVPGEIDESDNTIYKFPRIVSKRHDGKESYYDIIVRVASGVPSTAKGVKEIEKYQEVFLPIQDSYFDSKTTLPEGAYGWYKVNYYAVKDSEPGKGQKPTRVYQGKNIGKKNETNPFTQALRDALSRYNKQIQKSQEDVADEDFIKAELIPPMLAETDSSFIEKITFGDGKNDGDDNSVESSAQSSKVYIQPKLNGTRGVACLNLKDLGDKLPAGDIDKKILLYTRQRKVIKGLNYIKEEALPVLEQFREKNGFRLRLDGEFYLHGTHLELISGAMRKELNSDEAELKLEYHLYDCFSEDRPDAIFSERQTWLEQVFAGVGVNTSSLPANANAPFKYLKMVPTTQVNSLTEIETNYKQYLDDGYEGAIVRVDMPYKYSYNNRRARWLLKKKPVFDDEFEIVGYDSADKGKASGWLKLILKTKNGKEFSLSNFGDKGDEMRQELYEKMSQPDPEAEPIPDGEGGTHLPTIFESKYKGKFITVLFDEWSRFGVPLRARTDGIVIRDYE